MRYQVEVYGCAVLDTISGLREWFNTPAEAIANAASKNKKHRACQELWCTIKALTG
jgi:hypothetical protein